MGTTTSSSSSNAPAAAPPPTGGGGLANPLSLLLKRNSNLHNATGRGETGSVTREDSAQPPHPPQYVLVKAKTRLHSTNKLVRKSAWYEAKPNTSMTIGRSDQCDMVLDDDRCAVINARIASVAGAVQLVAEARMYRLIGMGLKPKSALVPLSVGMVIKVGSVSLEVTQLCTKEGDNFLQRFDAELAADKSSSVDAQATRPTRQQQESTDDHSDDDGEGGSHNTPTAEEEEVAQQEEEEPAPAVCYICWGGPEDPLTEEELSRIKSKGQQRTVPGAGPRELKHEPNPLIRNPCGKCSGSSRYVHLQCILTWIKSSGSGHCSICNGALPQHFSSPPPNIELKVVRHRRGHSWVGNRRFRLSFVDKPFVVIGRDAGCEVRLSDRSVCGEHAKVSFNRDDKQFYISDCASLTGTYVQLVGRLDLPHDGEPTYVKIGRSTLSLRLTTSKRNSFVRSILPFNRG